MNKGWGFIWDPIHTRHSTKECKRIGVTCSVVTEKTNKFYPHGKCTPPLTGAVLVRFRAQRCHSILHSYVITPCTALPLSFQIALLRTKGVTDSPTVLWKMAASVVIKHESGHHSPLLNALSERFSQPATKRGITR